MQKYRTVATAGEGIIRERGSKFLASAQSVSTVKACEDILADLRKDHPKARHFCYAYRLGEDGGIFRSTDDGEPSGTAGRPILARIDSYNLTFVLVVVVRYFGGKLLGAAGLLRAYRDAAEEALGDATFVEKLIARPYILQTPYPFVGRVEEALGRYNVVVTERDFKEQAVFTLDLPKDEADGLINSILSYVLELPTDQVGERKEMLGLMIKPYSSGSKFNDNELRQ